MPKKNSAGFLSGLIVEGVVIGLVVTLLPKVQLGKPASPANAAADQRPSLAPLRLRHAEEFLEPTKNPARSRPPANPYRY
jgi:hypothetical protein